MGIWTKATPVAGAAGRRSASAAKLWLCREEFAAEAAPTDGGVGIDFDRSHVERVRVGMQAETLRVSVRRTQSVLSVGTIDTDGGEGIEAIKVKQKLNAV